MDQNHTHNSSDSRQLDPKSALIGQGDTGISGWLENGVTQTIADMTRTVLLWNDKKYDVYNELNLTTGTFIPKKTGWYQICSTILWKTGNHSGSYILTIELTSNSSGRSQTINSQLQLSTFPTTQTLAQCAFMVAGDTLQVTVTSITGNTSYIDGATNYNNLSIRKLN